MNDTSSSLVSLLFVFRSWWTRRVARCRIRTFFGFCFGGKRAWKWDGNEKHNAETFWKPKSLQEEKKIINTRRKYSIVSLRLEAFLSVCCWLLLCWECKRTSCYYYNGNEKEERRKEHEMCVPKVEGRENSQHNSSGGSLLWHEAKPRQWDGKSHIQMPKVHWLYFRFNITFLLYIFSLICCSPRKNVTVSFSIVLRLYFHVQRIARLDSPQK